MSDIRATLCRHCRAPVTARLVEGSWVLFNPDESPHDPCPSAPLPEPPQTFEELRIPTGEELRDEGAARVEENQEQDDDGEWREAAWTELIRLAVAGVEFNADDIRAEVGSPTRANAMGALFLRAVREGLIERVGERGMTRPIAHARRTATYIGTAKIRRDV